MIYYINKCEQKKKNSIYVYDGESMSEIDNFYVYCFQVSLVSTIKTTLGENIVSTIVYIYVYFASHVRYSGKTY